MHLQPLAISTVMERKEKKLQPGMIVRCSNQLTRQDILAIIVQNGNTMMAAYKLVYTTEHVARPQVVDEITKDIYCKDCYEYNWYLSNFDRIEILLDNADNITVAVLNNLLGPIYMLGDNGNYADGPRIINEDRYSEERIIKEKLDFLKKAQAECEQRYLLAVNDELQAYAGNPYCNRLDVVNHGAMIVTANTAFKPLPAIKETFLNECDIEIDDDHKFCLVNLQVSMIRDNVYLACFDVLVLPKQELAID